MALPRTLSYSEYATMWDNLSMSQSFSKQFLDTYDRRSMMTTPYPINNMYHIKEGTNYIHCRTSSKGMEWTTNRLTTSTSFLLKEFVRIEDDFYVFKNGTELFYFRVEDVRML